MKTLSIALKIEGIKLDKQDENKSPGELATIVMKNIILSWASSGNRRGLSEEDRRRYYKISDAFEKALREGLTDVELEDDWFGFLKKCKREAELVPNDFVRRVEELIDEVKDR